MKINRKEVVVITTCPFCGHINEIAINEEDYVEWKAGAMIQNAFPYLSADEREAIKTGICTRCWDNMFGAVN